MTFRSLAALTVLGVTAGTALVAAPAVATPTPPALYVAGSTDCTDGPTHTANQPYCTLQAAVDAAQPGQSVLINPAYTAHGPVTLTHSGAPGAPITISAIGAAYNEAAVTSTGGQPTFTLSGVHDIVLEHLRVTGDGDAVAIDGSSNVTLLDDELLDNNAQATTSSLVAVTGASSGITVTRTTLHSVAAGAVSVGTGATGVSVTGNLVEGDGANGITATDADSTVITGNTVYGTCADQIQLAGASTNSVVENNIVTHLAGEAACAAPGGDGAQVSVSAGSATGSVLDYNIVNPPSGQSAYSWAGTTYADPAALRTATGQGGHDLVTDPLLGLGGTPQEGSPAIDSGDALAKGVTDLDVEGNPRMVDDLLTQNTGTSQGYLDRGAIEVQDPYRLTGLTADHSTGSFPLPVTFSATESNPWGTPATYTWNFGDGSKPVTTTTPTTTYTYVSAPAAGHSYIATVDVKTADGLTHSTYLSGITPSDPGPLTPRFSITRVGDAFTLSVHIDSSASQDPLSIVRRTVDFGDGTPTADITATGTVDHTYATTGNYTVTLTETDAAGRTVSSTGSEVVGELAVPRHDLMARDGSGNLWLYQGTGKEAAPFHPRALVGSGWNTYNMLTLPDGHPAVGMGGNMFARDTSGVLWLFPGSGNSTNPFGSRIRVGSGWGIYNSVVGIGSIAGGDTDLVARDASGVLWYYASTGHNSAPLRSRVRVGSGWNAYTSLVGVGMIGSNNSSDLLARDASGVLWLYQGTGNPAAPFGPRTRVGSGWNIYTSITPARDLNNDGSNDLVARDASGVLWLYPGTNNPAAPYGPRVRIGSGWNAYNTLIG